jgi:putative FmdB family regulatory protein
MPYYEYTCQNCGEILETRQNYDDEPLTECPYCDGELQKNLTTAAFVFKGPGFFENDYKKKN